jgi:hypothetical protein
LRRLKTTRWDVAGGIVAGVQEHPAAGDRIRI